MQSKIQNILIFFANVLIFLILLLFVGSFLLPYLLENGSKEKIPSEERLSLPNLNVKILNTTTNPGLAKEMKNYLKIFEIRNTFVGNDSLQTNSTVIFTKFGSYKQAKMLGLILGLDSTNVSYDQQLDTSQFDCVIFIGKDYKLLKPFRR